MQAQELETEEPAHTHAHFFQGEKGMKSVIFVMLSRTGQAQKDGCLCGPQKLTSLMQNQESCREDAEGVTAHQQ